MPTAFGPLIVGAALVLGILIGESTTSDSRPGYVIGACCTVAALVCARRRRLTCVVIAAMSIGVGGGASVARDRALPSNWEFPPGFVIIDGSISDEAAGHQYQSSVVVAAESIDEFPFDRKIRVQANGRSALRLRALRRGDVVRVRARVRPAHGDVWAVRSGAIAVADDSEVIGFVPSNALHLHLGGVVRARIERGVRLLGERDRGLVLGFLLGDTSGIDRDDRDAFRRSGLSHLLAVSGANVAFVLALFGPLLRRVGYRLRFAIGISVVLVFAAATRFEPSVLRAAAMAAVVMLARVSGRDVHPARALAFAVVGLLVVDPSLVHSIGFRLSVTATAGIVIGASAIARRIRGPSGVQQAIGVTLAAQLAVAPMLVVEFGSVPLIALVANLVAAPAAAPLTLHGLVAAAVAPSLPRPLARLVLAPCSWLVSWIRGVAHLGARVPIELDGRGLALSVLAVVVVTIARRRIRG